MLKNSLASKFLAINIIYMLIPLIVIICLLNLFFTKNVLEEEKKIDNYIINDVSSSVNDTISMLNNTSLSIISNEAIRNYVLNINASDSESLRFYTQASSALQDMNFQNQGIKDIYILGMNGQSLHSGVNMNIVFTENEKKLLKKYKARWFLNYENNQLSMCFIIRDIYDISINTAYAKIIVNTSTFYKYFNKEDIPKGIYFSLIGEEGSLLLHNVKDDNDWLIEDAYKNFNFNTSEFKVSRNDTTFKVSPKRLFDGRAYLLGLCYDKTHEYTRVLYISILVIFVLFFLLLFMQSYFYKRMLINPIRNLGSLMKSITSENYTVRFRSKVSSEIQTLADEFNIMSNKLQFLYTEVYSSNLKLKEAELKSLQVEINPHFLYNTLDSICWMIQLQRYENASEMVRMLSTLFRLSLYRTATGLIPLEVEIEHAKCYIGLEKLRFDGKFDFTIDIQEGIQDLSVMKLVLQPILENAVCHGISSLKEHGEILLAIYTQENELIYYIYDNGVGMDTDSFKRILESEQEASSTHGIALKNINERISLKFGEHYGLTYHKPTDGGSVFFVKQPIISKGE